MNTVAAILDLLKATNRTVATAESVTAGQMQRMLASVSGSSDVFIGGMTAYQRSIKVEYLGVDDGLAHETDCVDEEVARQMALGALRFFHSDYGLSTCGYAEREDGQPYAFYAIARAPGNILASGRLELSGSRVEAQRSAAEAVLEKFRDLLANEAANQ